MPKKFVGENSKAVVARARKAAVKEAENVKKQKEIEDVMWRDNDKNMVKKQQRKEAEEQKRQQLLQKKAEAKELLEKELASIKVSSGKQPIAKITRAQIQSENEKRQQAAEAASAKKPVTHVGIPLEENINRITLDSEVATNVDEAIHVLGAAQLAEDKHPEKRMKAAFTAFEERMMPQLKSDNPTLRLSQLKQMLRKEWQKSPDNPLNQRLKS